MCDLHEAAENVRAMEAAYKATEVPAAPDVRPCEDELEPMRDTRAFTNTVAALALVGVVLVAFLT